MAKGYLVTEEIQNAHFILDYPLYEEDLLVEQEDGTFFKEGPGMGIGGFTLSEAQKTTLKPVNFRFVGIDYVIY